MGRRKQAIQKATLKGPYQVLGLKIGRISKEQLFQIMFNHC